MATSLNDVKRSKLYEAERRFAASLPADHPLVTSEEDREAAEAFVTRIAELVGSPGRVPVTENPRRAGAISFNHTRWIELDGSAWARQRWVLLHELAHTLTSHHFPGHGREFVANYRRVVAAYLEEELGAEAGPALTMMDAYLEGCGCRWEVTAKERSTFRHLLRKVQKEGPWSVTVVTRDGERHRGMFELDADADVARALAPGASTATPRGHEVPIEDVAYLLWQRRG